MFDLRQITVAIKTARLAILLLAVTAVTASAQMSDAQRLERCANNQGRIAAIDKQFREGGPAYWSDQRISDVIKTLPDLEKRENFINIQYKLLEYQIKSAEFLPKDLQSDIVTGLTGFRNAIKDEERKMETEAKIIGVLCDPKKLVPYCWQRIVPAVRLIIRDADANKANRDALQRQRREHQNNLIALSCDQAVVPVATTATQWMTGSFDTSEGVMTLSPGGGSYTQDSGVIRVQSVVGVVMEGIWEETSSAQRCANGKYYGHFKWTFTPTGFSGSWGYCEDALSSSWTGKRK